jgi:hypothetical protein
MKISSFLSWRRVAAAVALVGVGLKWSGALDRNEHYTVGVYQFLAGLALENTGPRAALTAEQVSEGLDLTGRVAVVTGANAGLGKETARVLAMRGAHVIMACRDMKRGQEALEDIQPPASPTAGKLQLLPLNLGSLQSVREFAAAFLALDLPLHYLINNAGVMQLPSYTASADGHELQFAVNHLG